MKLSVIKERLYLNQDIEDLRELFYNPEEYFSFDACDELNKLDPQVIFRDETACTGCKWIAPYGWMEREDCLVHELCKRITGSSFSKLNPEIIEIEGVKYILL